MTCVWATEEEAGGGQAELTVAKRILVMCVALIFYQNVFRVAFVVAATAFVVVFFIDQSVFIL